MGGDQITFKYRYRKQIIFISLGIILLFSILIPLIINYKPEGKKEKPLLISDSSTKKSSKKEDKSKEDTKSLLKVDIKGEVNNPGIYSLPASSRIIDVIELAGGLTENANTTVINLSKKIKDEMVIIIYSNREVEDFKKTKEIEKQVQSNCLQKDENALKNDACISDEVANPTKVSINSATLAQLDSLPGIGEEKAKDIIAYRERNGPFEKLEDLKNVSGIGDSLFAKIKDYITL